MNLNLEGKRDTEREGRGEMEGEMEWKFPKVKLTMIPRIKDNGMYYCRKEKTVFFPWGRYNPAPWHKAWWEEHSMLPVLIYSLCWMPWLGVTCSLYYYIYGFIKESTVSVDSCLLPGQWSFWFSSDWWGKRTKTRSVGRTLFQRQHSSVYFSHSVESDSLQPHGFAAHQASLSIISSRSLLKLMSIESMSRVQPSHPLPSPSPAFSPSQDRGQGKAKW